MSYFGFCGKFHPGNSVGFDLDGTKIHPLTTLRLQNTLSLARMLVWNARRDAIVLHFIKLFFDKAVPLFSFYRHCDPPHIPSEALRCTCPTLQFYFSHFAKTIYYIMHRDCKRFRGRQIGLRCVRVQGNFHNNVPLNFGPWRAQQFWGFSQSVISLIRSLVGQPIHSSSVIVNPSGNGADIFSTAWVNVRWAKIRVHRLITV